MEDLTQITNLSEVLEGSKIGISITDLNGHFLLVNQTYCDLTGYAQQELVRTDYQSITHPEDLADNLNLAERFLRGQIRNAVYEKRYIAKSGQIVWVRNSVSLLLDSLGKPAHGLAFSEDITSKKRAEEAMRNANRQLHQLSSELLRSQDYERRWIARELHDSTAQLLAGLNMNLCGLRDLEPNESANRELLTDSIDLASKCSREIRTLSYLLHPPLLEDMGLASALETYAEEFRRRAGIEVEVRISPDFGRLTRDVEATIFRIIQEGLANIYKHSGSPIAVIKLERSYDQVLMELLDRGCGLPQVLSRGDRRVGLGVGILGMRERAELLGGRLDLTSRSGGTKVTLTLPLRDSDEENPNPRGR